MASALLAQSHGVETTLFESHRTPGGSAGWFRRGAFSFDVGATTLSGIGEDRPLTRLCQMTGAPLLVWPADPGITFHLGSEKFSYRRDREFWLHELQRVFPDIAHRKFWDDIESLQKRAWKLLPSLHHFPPAKLSDLAEIPQWLKGTSLLPTIAMDLTTFRRMRQGTSQKFERWLNALCMISAQNRADEVPALIGSLALTYPAETYLPQGGMEGLFSGWLSHFEKRGGEFRSQTEISGIRVSDFCELSLVNGQENFHQVVANLTSASLDTLLGISSSRSEEGWGAFTLYAAIRTDDDPIQESYHLIIPEEGIDDYFVSLSHPKDRLRAPLGWQTLTLSQHTVVEDWWMLSRDEYQAKKKERMEMIWQDVLKRFPNIKEVKFLTAGTPKTFFHYTRRLDGRVGGRPHKKSYPFWRWPSHYHSRNLSQVGDTVFPGQGLVAVVTSAMNWWHGSVLNPHLKRRG
jgi:phytoene dehydrogenase-like protein